MVNYTYDVYGNKNRSTLEELLRGEIAGLPDIVEPTVLLNSDEAADIPTELEWATTEYLYDITQEYYQVIEETTSSKNSSTTTAYAYGLERIAAYTDSQTTHYVYDGRGSVAQAISAPVAGEAVSSALPDVAVNVQSFAYTAFGEQMGKIKTSGFTYNAEAYDVATDMLDLRARQYEPAMNRFSQKDMLHGKSLTPQSQNRYGYVGNNPINYTDPMGQEAIPEFEMDFSQVEQITTQEAYDINGGKRRVHVPGEGTLYDIESGKTINIVWGNIPDKYHTDWSPATDADVDIIKSILHPELKPEDKAWDQSQNWSWDARSAVLIMNDGTQAAVGIHFKPHLSVVGNAKLTTLKNAKGEGTKDLGGHMCMYYGDSQNSLSEKADPKHKYNAAASEAAEISKPISKTSSFLKSPATTAVINSIVKKAVSVVRAIPTIAAIASVIKTVAKSVKNIRM